LWNSRERYTPSAKFTTFLYTVVRRTMIDRMRGGARRSALLARYAQELETAEHPSPKYCLEEDAEQLLSCLSPEQRETVVLVIMRGMQYNEAAEVLRIPVGTVKSRVSIAIAKMKELSNESRTNPA